MSRQASPRTARAEHVLVGSVLIAAACGLGYELIAGALSSYLLGDSIFQFSSIIGCYLFAMGIGAYVARFIADRDVLARFIEIELLVGLIGGLSASVLFLVFAWFSAPFRGVLYVLVFVIGTLVGMEIPLAMRVLNARKAAFNELVSRVLTFDYLGALVVSLLFPMVLAPELGLSRTGFLFGFLNAALALVLAHAFRDELPHSPARMFRSLLVLGILAGGFAVSGQLTHWAERGLFQDEIVLARSSPYQRIVVTRWKDDTRLYIDGNLQFSSRDEHRYHEALVHPSLQALPWARHVLVIGGGDGLAVREILKHAQVETITLVDLDQVMTDLFTHNRELAGLNREALRDRRVRVINADAAQWLEQDEGMYDAIFVDLPDPSNFGLGKLYSVPMYRLLSRHLSERGYVTVQSTSPYFAPRAFWDIDATLREAGLNTWPYHAYVPSFGEWGFILAGRRSDYTPPTHYSVPTRFLDAQSTALMFRFPSDMRPSELSRPNRLNEQSLVHDFERDWADVLR